MKVTTMWSVQFWLGEKMIGFNKHWGDKPSAMAWARLCRKKDRAIAGTEIKLVDLRA